MEKSLLAVLTAGGRGMVMFVKNMATVERKQREAGHLQEVLKEHLCKCIAGASGCGCVFYNIQQQSVNFLAFWYLTCILIFTYG